VNRFASQLGAKGRRARSAVLVGIAALISGAFVVPPAHALVDMGPLDATGFPAWYEDGNGLSLQPCNVAATCGGAVDPADRLYFGADARMPATINQTARLSMGLVATFGGGVVLAGDQVTNEVFRFEIPGGLVPLANYTVTYPYGVETFTADAKGAIKVVRVNGCVEAPCDFTQAIRTGYITNYLTWDPSIAPAPPAGFIADGLTPHSVVGSPLGTNFFRVTGPNVGGLRVNSIQTTDFTITGQLADPATFVAPTAPAFSAAAGPGSGELTVSWTPPVRDGGSAVTAYHVFGGDSPGSLSSLAIVDASSRSFTETGLGEGVVRYYKVAAINAVGESNLAATPAVSATTFVKPTEPQNLVAHPGSGLLTVDLSWMAPDSDGGSPVTTYTIYRAQGSGAYSPIATVNGNTLSFTDSGLLPVLSYRYTVSASNLVGESDQTASQCSRAFPWVDALNALLPCGTPL